MAKLFQTLFRGSGGKPSSEISRYDLSWYLQQLNNPYALYSGQSTTYRDGRNVEDIGNNFAGYVQQAYAANGPIFAIVLARLLLFSEARFMFRRLIAGRPGDLFGGENGELSLLSRPWPNGTTGELLGRMEQDVSLGGNFYAVNEADRLRRLRPDWVSIVLTGDPDSDADVDVAGYAFTPGGLGRGEPKFFLPEDMCHWSPIPDPMSQYRGMSWVTPVVRELQSDQAATDHKSQFFKNGASPRLVVSLKESVREEQFKKFVRAMAESTGGADQAYKTMYLAGGADVTVAGADLRQLDFRATQGAGETRLCAAGGVPPIIVGLSEGLQAATYSNYASARRKFGDHWARPQWRSACAALATITEVPDGAELWYDDRDISFLREDQKDAAAIQGTRATTINVYITAGFTPESAVQAVINDDETLLVHSGMVSVQLQPPGGGVPEDGAAPAGDVPPPLDGPATDEDTDALVDAMAELDTAARAWSGTQAALHPRGPGGKFKSTKDRLVQSIEAHLNGGGGAHPFDGFNREQLRRVAKARGLELKKGASRDDISKSLLDSLRGEANPAGLTGKDGAKLAGVRQPKVKAPAAKPEAAPKPEAPEKPATPKPASPSAEPTPPDASPKFRGGTFSEAMSGGRGLQRSDLPEVQRFMEESTNFTHPGSGMTATVTSVNRRLSLNSDAPTGIDVNYEIRDRDGNVVGNAWRQWNPPSVNDYGHPVPARVDHQSFHLDPSAQGNGFARAWNERMVDVYRTNGVREIHLTANEDVGGYAWAKQGFGWADDEGETAHDMAGRLDQQVQGSGWPAADVQEFRALAERLRSSDPEQVPTPLELSMVGWTPGAKTWPGKQFMLANAWEGRRVL